MTLPTIFKSHGACSRGRHPGDHLEPKGRCVGPDFRLKRGTVVVEFRKMADENPRAGEVTNLTPEQVAAGLREGRILLVDVARTE